MPCTYTGSLDGDRIMGLEEALDEMTELACSAFAVLEKQGLLGEMTFSQRKWWRVHKAADAARLRREQEESE
jgi:hypothetical protein